MVFTVIAIIGILALIIGIVGDGILDAVMPDVDAGGFLSLPVLGAFAGAFGIAGAISTAAGLSVGVSCIIGVAAGAALGLCASLAMKAMQNSETGIAAQTESIIGETGTIITAVPAAGYGGIRIRLAGHITTLSATADEPIPAGTQVKVTAALSSTSVKVTPL